MELNNSLIQTQKLTLSPQLQQTMYCLSLSATELDAYLSDVALSNPLIDYEPTILSSSSPVSDPSVSVSLKESWNDIPDRTAAPDSKWSPVDDIPNMQTFSDYLIWQLTRFRYLDEKLYPICVYLINCLNSAGYLDYPLEELSAEYGCSLFDMQQALFVLQELDPPGTGARNLSECLLLQLTRSPHFSVDTVHLINYGLPLLAQKDYKGLSELLKISESDVKKAAKVIQSLNPIPSNGFANQSVQPYTVPEAVVYRDGDKLTIEMCSRKWRQLSCSREYTEMIGDADHAEIQDYLKQKKREADSLINALNERDQLMQQVIEYVVRKQKMYLLYAQPLLPMTMADVAEELNVSVSTISRAIREKYIVMGTQTISLRSLFSTKIDASNGSAVSAEFAKMQIKRLILSENKASPLSDQTISDILKGMGISLSRRAVASYRAKMNIPGTFERKKNQ